MFQENAEPTHRPNSNPDTVFQENAAQEKAMLEEDIDAILDRAEVVDTAAIAESSRPNGSGAEGGPSGGPGDLLNSFNVASFRGVEDDTAFWNKLIPVLERPAEEVGHDMMLGAGGR